MAKRRRAPARQPEISRSTLAAVQRRNAPAPRRSAPPARRLNTTWLLIGGGAAVIVVLVGLALVLGWFPGNGPGGATAGAAPCVIPASPQPSGPPAATPLASPPAQPVSDGTTATIHTDKGNIVIKLDCGSAPVAAQNFIDLATAGFYNGLVFHRIVPGFVIQGGDPNGDGSGGPGYSIQDEPVVGDYTRGVVAMARTSAPNSQGSQFFICLADLRQQLPKSGGYVIFGTVTSGMDVVDQVAAGAAGGPGGDTALKPVKMNQVTVQRP